MTVTMFSSTSTKSIKHRLTVYFKKTINLKNTITSEKKLFNIFHYTKLETLFAEDRDTNGFDYI